MTWAAEVAEHITFQVISEEDDDMYSRDVLPEEVFFKMNSHPCSTGSEEDNIEGIFP